MTSIDRQTEGNHNRRMANEKRILGRWDELANREESASAMVGELCRNGKTVHYIWPVGGKYREGNRLDLIAFLVRNRYV